MTTSCKALFLSLKALAHPPYGGVKAQIANHDRDDIRANSAVLMSGTKHSPERRASAARARPNRRELHWLHKTRAALEYKQLRLARPSAQQTQKKLSWLSFTRVEVHACCYCSFLFPSRKHLVKSQLFFFVYALRGAPQKPDAA